MSGQRFPFGNMQRFHNNRFHCSASDDFKLKQYNNPSRISYSYANSERHMCVRIRIHPKIDGAALNNLCERHQLARCCTRIICGFVYHHSEWTLHDFVFVFQRKMATPFEYVFRMDACNMHNAYSFICNLRMELLLTVAAAHLHFTQPFIFYFIFHNNNFILCNVDGACWDFIIVRCILSPANGTLLHSFHFILEKQKGILINVHLAWQKSKTATDSGSWYRTIIVNESNQCRSLLINEKNMNNNLRRVFFFFIRRTHSSWRRAWNSR